MWNYIFPIKFVDQKSNQVSWDVEKSHVMEVRDFIIEL